MEGANLRMPCSCIVPFDMLYDAFAIGERIRGGGGGEFCHIYVDCDY